jgi:hypothetical protein
MASAPSFSTVYGQFLDDLKGTFPEYTAAVALASSLPAESSATRFVEVWHKHTASVASQDAHVFDGPGIELVPGFVMTSELWSDLGPSTHAAIWKYLSTLLLLAASSAGSADMWDISGFHDSMESMMKHLKEGGEGGAFSTMFEQLNKMAETFGVKDLSGAGFKIPERLFKGHIAKIVEELVKEFKPEDFGVTEEMMSAKDPKVIFTNLQEIFTKKPELLMTAGQKIAKRLQAKFASGAIKREEIISEVEELMKEFSDNEQFSELFGSLGEMLKSSDRESGNEHSARLRETRERMRRKAAERDARRATAGPVANVVAINADAEARAAAITAALLLEEDVSASKKKGPAKRR